MIPFNKPPCVGKEVEYIQQAIANNKICGDGVFTKKCHEWFEQNLGIEKALLTTSCTHALEMAAILCDIKQDDEVIMPSFTFVSTANAFVMRGAKIVFVDVRPDTMNINEHLIEAAITHKTKAIVVVHYAGVSCEMDYIMRIAKKHHLFIIEDAAQAMMSIYKGQPLGTIGDFGCFSFHETKNYSMGEGGALLIKHQQYIERAEIIREKGTNRSKFWRGQVDKYTWVDQGSSYLPSDMNAAYLYAQLERVEHIRQHRLSLWQAYQRELQILEKERKITLPFIPKAVGHNAHMFYIKVKDIEQRAQLIDFLKQRNILSVFHYIPLHSSPAGLIFGHFYGEDEWTTQESQRLLRLPMYYELTLEEVVYITKQIKMFFK